VGDDGGMTTPLDRSTIWPYERGELGEYYYSRYGSPTVAEAEKALGELDGGRALLFASGSAAITAVVLALLEPGQTIALAQDAYYGTSVLLRLLERWGLRFVEFDQTRPAPEGVDLVWLETPSNPLLSFPDIETFTRGEALVVVDSTAATPVLLRPLEHGADIALHSATKYLGGHSDVLLGAVACRRDDHFERLLEFRSRTGIVPAPDTAWLLLRSLATLELRVRRQSETALALARRLSQHPAVERVHYPGVDDEVAARYLRGGFGGLLSFEVAGGAAAARRVETSTRTIANATSLGGVKSVLETRHRWEGDRVPESLVRLSVGLEDVDELWADLEQALSSGDGAPVAGVDGYRGGWVAVVLDSTGSRVVTAQDFADIASLDVDVLAVDIPIGIPETERAADVEARKVVGPRASSVFTTPPRAALEAPTFAEAVAKARAATGKGISQQAYALRHRILEVDAFAEHDARIVEIHPEVSFAELAAAALPHSKRTAEGLAARRQLLASAGIDVPEAPAVPEADLLDAAVAAWTARRYQRGEAKPLPGHHEGRIGAIWR
jgi:cystathionine gamma-synthase